MSDVTNPSVSSPTTPAPSLWQRFASVFSTYFAYRPYGNNLLSDRARVFFLWMLLLTLATAGLEAYTWFQLIVGDPTYKNLTASDSGYFLPWILAAGVFVSAWMIDSSIVLLSTDSLERWEKLAGIKPKEQSNLEKTVEVFKTYIWKPFIQYGLRTALFLFTVAAVGLGSIVSKERVSLERESVAALSTQIDSALFAKKTELESNAGIPALQKEIKQLDDERIKEISGSVGSGKLGNGPTAQAMAINIQAKIAQLKAANNAVNKQYAEIEAAAVKLKSGQYDAAALDKLSAIGFTVQDPRSNTAVIMRLLERFTGGAADKEGKSKAPSAPWYIHLLNFLFSMHGAIILPFLAMLISKIFQPEAARIYLSEELQGGWQTIQRVDRSYLYQYGDFPIANVLLEAKSADMYEFSQLWYPFKSAIKHIYGAKKTENLINFLLMSSQKRNEKTEDLFDQVWIYLMQGTSLEVKLTKDVSSDDLKNFDMPHSTNNFSTSNFEALKQKRIEAINILITENLNSSNRKITSDLIAGIDTKIAEVKNEL